MKPIPTETATDVGSVGKWLGAAAAGALLMYLLDPERGSARRSRALSALRTAGARTGATVDHALHNAGDRLVGLKDSAASALSRGADRLHAQTAPMIERARHGAQEATHRLEDSAERARARARAWEASADARSRHDIESSHSPERYNRYEPSRDYGAGERGLGGGTDYRGADAPHPALLGGGMLGLLSLMRRSPGGLLVGLAGLALLMQATRNKTYRVSDNMSGSIRDTARDRSTGQHDSDQRGQAPLGAAGEQAGSRYLH
jgi:hypothetical protein